MADKMVSNTGNVSAFPENIGFYSGYTFKNQGSLVTRSMGRHTS